MKRDDYHPFRIEVQPEGHFNYAQGLEDEGVGICLLLATVTASVNDKLPPPAQVAASGHARVICTRFKMCGHRLHPGLKFPESRP